MYNDIIHHYSIIQTIFTTLSIHPSSPLNLWQPPIFLCLHNFVFSENKWNYTVLAISDWFLSLINIHLRFFHVFFLSFFFNVLTAHFFLVLDNITLSWCPANYPFTCWITSWLLPSFMKEASKASVYRFLCVYKFPTLLSKYQECVC